MSEITLAQYDAVVSECRDLFAAKMTDYGASWLLFRQPSITDQILIKAKRIRTLEQLNDRSKVQEGRDSEYKGILNYCVMALLRLHHSEQLPSADEALSSGGLPAVTTRQITALYNQVIAETKALMLRKNHDYGEAWRDMRLSSITDQILVKLARLRAIETNDGKVRVSETSDAIYADILNWCVFALIKLHEQNGSGNGS